MRHSKCRLSTPFAARGLLCLAACGCSSTDLTELNSVEQREASRFGRVALAVDADGVEAGEWRYAVKDESGHEVLVGESPASGSEAAFFVAFDLPAATTYSIEMSVISPGGLASCAGATTFDVVAGETRDVSLELACTNSGPGVGGTRITATLSEAPHCPQLEIATGPLAVRVGDSIELRLVGEHIQEEGAEHDGHEGSHEAAGFTWRASAGLIDEPEAAQALFTCTEVGGATLTLASKDPGCQQTAIVEVTCAGEVLPAEGDACAGLGTTCHLVDPGTGPLHECHEVGHSGDALACEQARGACVQGCGEQLCETLGSLCHAVSSGSGPLHECHELGHAGDAVACFERGRECFELCTAAQAALDPVPVTLTFAAKVGQEDFACGESYEAVGSPPATVQPQDFRFFVQDVRLVTGAGEEVPVTLEERAPWQSSQVALLDFETTRGLCFNGDAATNAVVTGSVPPGDYQGVVFSNGVPAALNHSDPASQPDPLTAGGMHWGWLSGFRFLRAELSGPLGATGPGIGLLHAGSSSCGGSPQDGSVVCSRPNRNEVRLGGFDPASSVIVADIAEIFSATDLSGGSLCHSAGPACASMFSSLGVDLLSGQPSGGQTVFRVE